MARAAAASAARRTTADEDARAETLPLADFARCLYASRRLRDGLFPPGLFGEPAWDILLDLFAAEAEGKPVDVSSACVAAAVPQTTALRYVGRLEAIGLVRRRPVATDRRRSMLHLTAVGRVTVESVLAELCDTWWTQVAARSGVAGSAGAPGPPRGDELAAGG